MVKLSAVGGNDWNMACGRRALSDPNRYHWTAPVHLTDDRHGLAIAAASGSDALAVAA